jgi:hypothetical protein
VILTHSPTLHAGQSRGLDQTLAKPGGRPKARRMLTETTTDQNHLIDIFDLHQWAPRT